MRPGAGGYRLGWPQTNYECVALPDYRGVGMRVRAWCDLLRGRQHGRASNVVETSPKVH